MKSPSPYTLPTRTAKSLEKAMESEIVYGGDVVDKEADLDHLKQEVEQIRAIMHSLRMSQDGGRASTIMSQLFRSQEGAIPKDENPTPALKRIGALAGEYQPNLQMFQSLSMMSEISNPLSKELPKEVSRES